MAATSRSSPAADCPGAVTFEVHVSWGRGVRAFHWINVAAVLVLVAGGFVVMYIGRLGIPPSGALTLKAIHVWAGYVFTLNLLFRLALAMRNHHRYHSPWGRLAATSMFLVMIVLAGTGLVLAGAFIYYPPFGHWFAAWVAAPGVLPADVVPYEPALVSIAAFDELRRFRQPFSLAHEYGTYVLLAFIVLHIMALARIEKRGIPIITSMVTGRRLLPPAGDGTPARH